MLILGVGVFVWPLLAELTILLSRGLIERSIDGGIGGLTVGEMFSVVFWGYHAVQGLLILLGMLLVARGMNTSPINSART